MTHDKFYLPDPLYRTLPFLYICAGVLVITWRLSARTRRRRRARQRAARRAASMDSLSPRISNRGEMRWE